MRHRFSVGVAAALGLLLAGPIASAAETKAAALPSDAAVATVEATATVVNVDQKTREVTLKKEDGTEFKFIAGDAVKNLAQVKAGDRLKVRYAEGVAYEVKKGGSAVGPATTVAGQRAAEGAKPGGAMARQTTLTVVITAIDTKAPSVTLKHADGTTETLKVLHPEKLQGVKVGDTVEVTYTEALALKMEEAPKK
jgi:Cu/Ag efflux protein CusF